MVDGLRLPGKTVTQFMVWQVRQAFLARITEDFLRPKGVLVMAFGGSRLGTMDMGFLGMRRDLGQEFGGPIQVEIPLVLGRLLMPETSMEMLTLMEIYTDMSLEEPIELFLLHSDILTELVFKV